MSFVDKVKQFLGQHGDQVDKAQEQAKKTAERWGEEGHRP